MSSLLDRLKSDPNFAQELQAKAEKLKGPSPKRKDVEDCLSMMCETPQQLEKLTAILDTEAGIQASATITTLTTFPTITLS